MNGARLNAALCLRLSRRVAGLLRLPCRSKGDIGGLRLPGSMNFADRALGRRNLLLAVEEDTLLHVSQTELAGAIESQPCRW